MLPRPVRRVSAFALLVCAVSCQDEAPRGLRRTPAGAGPTVRFDLGHRPLPDIPFPNDVATWPDPTSRTGLRVNASLLAATSIERAAREKFSELEGWGTYAPISVAFDAVEPGSDAAIDLAGIAARHWKDDFEPGNDAIYVVNLRTGVPVPLDMGDGSFSYTLREPNAYWRADPHAGQPTLLFETRDESGKDPRATYSPALDTDFDGVLDRPNLDDPYVCEGRSGIDRDTCVSDHLLTFYERETDTLLLRPLVPLEQKTEYAVVVTDRVRDKAGRMAKSPFDFVYHPAQEASIARLQAHLRSSAHAAYFGDIAGTGLDHVAFAWTFTTQPTTEDLALLRDGLYGRGPFARLATDFPARMTPRRLVGVSTAGERAEGSEPADWQSDPRCLGKTQNLNILDFKAFKDALGSLASIGFGLPEPELAALITSFDYIDHLVVGQIRTPFLIPGGPRGTDPDASFRINFKTGEGEIGEDTVNFIIAIPKPTATLKAPFPVNVFGHGYGGSNIQAIAYAGNMARQGIATVALDAVWHGLDLDRTKRNLAENITRQVCAAPVADALFAGRARDLDGDGLVDSGGDFLSTYVFHTRDNLRQSVLDRMQLVRVLRSFDGQRRGEDYDGDGVVDLAGDFNADGVPDLGGPNVAIGTWGQSLGGILSSIHGGIDTALDAAAPASPGGGMTDIIARSNEHEVVNASVLRTIGPLITGVPASTFYDAKNVPKGTSCAKGEMSLRLIVPTVNRYAELEFGCGSAADFPEGQATVKITNLATRETRCARTGAGGQFRFGLPTSTGDRLVLEVYEGPDRVDSYKTCNVPGDLAPRVTIDTWGRGSVTDPRCSSADGCTEFETRLFPAGGRLVSPVEGLGLARGSPELRRFLQLTQTVLDPADPISYAPLYALAPPPDHRTGATASARGLLTIATVGDQTVPVSTAIALARAAGAVPFLTPDAGLRLPEWASYATPPTLFHSLGNRTPNQLLIDNHAIEGLARLARHPAASTCQANEATTAACHPACPMGTECFSGQHCGLTPSSPQPKICYGNVPNCAEALFDTDDIDDGLAPYQEQRSALPLRLARIAAASDPTNLDAVWAPRIRGVPRGPDAGGWGATDRTVALLNAYIVPEGQHAFYNPAPCQKWDNSTYLANLVAVYLASGGRDLYYLSHPSTHECLRNHSCGFFL